MKHTKKEKKGFITQSAQLGEHRAGCWPDQLPKSLKKGKLILA